MEESITLKDFLAYYKKTMRLEPVDAGSYSPLVLAYIGDAVYEVMIRARVINRGSMQVNKMHKRSAMLVNAGTQAQLIRSIEEELTPQPFKNGAVSFCAKKHSWSGKKWYHSRF